MAFEFDEVTLAVPVCGFSEALFFLIELDYVIICFFYHAVKKNSFEKKNILLNFKKFMAC